MAKLMWICGILLVAAGVALGIVFLVSAARPGGIDIQTAAILLVGGVLALGLGGVIDGQTAAGQAACAAARSPEPVIRGQVGYSGIRPARHQDCRRSARSRRCRGGFRDRRGRGLPPDARHHPGP